MDSVVGGVKGNLKENHCFFVYFISFLCFGGSPKKRQTHMHSCLASQVAVSLVETRHIMFDIKGSTVRPWILFLQLQTNQAAPPPQPPTSTSTQTHKNANTNTNTNKHTHTHSAIGKTNSSTCREPLFGNCFIVSKETKGTPAICWEWPISKAANLFGLDSGTWSLVPEQVVCFPG